VRLPDGRGAPAGANAVQTNEDGEYRIWGLDPGRYYVTARYIVEGGLPTPPGPSRESWRETYYPGALAPDKAAVFDVTEKPEIDGIDFRILAVKGFRVSGKVTHPSIDLSEERPTIVLIPRGATIADERRNRPEYNQTWGGFDLREVLPGNYTLLATLFRWLPDANSTREVVAAGAIDVSVASDVTELNVPLSSSGVNVTGRVSSGARRLEVGLHALGDDTLSLPFLMEAAGQLTTQTLNGTFHFTNVPPGAYSVTINQTVVETRIDVGEKSPPPLQIVIKSD
jgi:hypothetical protein